MNRNVSIENKILKKSLKYSRTLKEKITQEVIKKLGLKTKFQLNDRFEGISFLDKHLKRVMGCKLVEQCLEIQLCSKDKVLKCLTDFEYEEKKYIIVYSKLDKIYFVNNKFDYLIYVSGGLDYNCSTIENLVSLEYLINIGVINKSTINNKKLLSFNLSSLK